jgi:hypothetical protein
MTAERLRQLRESGREFLAAPRTPVTANAETRTVDVCFFTGTPVNRVDWWTGDQYVLEFDPSGCDLSLLNSGAAVLDDHDDCDGAAGQMGVVDRAWQDGGQYFATLRFSKRPEVDGLWGDLQDGIVNKFSMGVELLDVTEERNQAGQLIKKTAKRWRPFEISVAPIPADFGTATLSRQGVVERATAQEEARVEEVTQTGVARTAEQEETLRAEGARQERERLTAIRSAAATFLARREITGDFIAQHENGGSTVAQFKAALVDHMAARSAATEVLPAHGEVVRDEVETRRELAGAALLNRMDPGRNTVDAQNGFRYMSCLRMAEELLTLGRVKVRGLPPTDIARLSMMNTADFPGILENTARKQLLATYALAAPTYRVWTKSSTSPDFKTMSRLRLGEAPSMLKVAEGVQIQLGTMSESKETYALATYGRGVAFTRQMLINDDLGAFMDLLNALSYQVARMENKTVYAILNANAAMADTVALFHANHGNLGTGAIGNTGLDAMVTSFKTQKGIDAVTVLNLEPKFLVVPAAKDNTARSTQTPSGPNLKPSDQNQFAGRFTVVSDGELDGTSTSVWYAACDPAVAPGIEYCHLEGAQGPQVIRKENENAILGVQIYMFEDFAAKSIDYRALYKSSGV